MVTLYMVCVAVGGTLIGSTLLLGGAQAEADVDLDTDLDVEADIDIEAEADLETEVHAEGGQSPAADVALAESHRQPRRLVRLLGRLLLSIRFWSFSSLTFGLTGLLLHLTGALPHEPEAALVAAATGLTAGVGAVVLIDALRRAEVDMGTSPARLVGRPARVLVALEPGRIGKVRTTVAGQTCDYLARCDDRHLDMDQSVVIYAIDEGTALVAPLDDGPVSHSSLDET